MNHFVGTRFQLGYLVGHKSQMSCFLVHMVHYRGTVLHFVGKVQYMGYMVVPHTDSVIGLQVYTLLQIDC